MCTQEEEAARRVQRFADKQAKSQEKRRAQLDAKSYKAGDEVCGHLTPHSADGKWRLIMHASAHSTLLLLHVAVVW